MQVDFHYYAIYALCCLAGMNPEYSEKVAYSSQHTDDAKYDHELIFENGGRFRQQMSAHEFLDLKVFSKEVGYDIFLPFHFLPGAEGEDFYEKLICRAKSKIAQEMLEDTLRTLDKPYGIHRLGITFHVYADTWSHQDFHGLLKIHNAVNDLAYINKSDSIFRPTAEYLPMIGHGQALHAPDEPYLIWSYKDYNMMEDKIINNPARFLDAAFNIYSYLTNQVHEKYPDLFVKDSHDWKQIESLFKEVFIFSGDLEDRIKNWKEKLKNNFFGFRAYIAYADREWFKNAVEVYKDSSLKDQYYKKPDFNESDWKYFHDALTYHSFFVKHELLPKYGIIT